MRIRIVTILATVILCLTPTSAWADLAPYDQDFEGLVQADPAALANDGWLVFGNVFNADWSYAYGYGVFVAPNGGPGFSAVAAGQGDAQQGAQQLVIYSDYNNADHANGRFIEANVFQEQIVGAADVGSTWLFEVDAKRGDIAGLTTARAFFKTIDPNAGFALTNFITNDMTGIPYAWDRYSLSIYIDQSLVGQILQFGFLSLATGYEPSGILYDNVDFRLQPLQASLDIKPGSCPNPVNSGPGNWIPSAILSTADQVSVASSRLDGLSPSRDRSAAVVPAAVLGNWDFDVNNIDIASLLLEGVAPTRSSYEDVAAPFGGDLCGCAENGPDGLMDLTLKFSREDLLTALGSPQRGDLSLTLTGTLLDGTPFEARDCIVLVPGGHRAYDTREKTTSRRSLLRD